tara:strand:- start:7133 stop:7465 length:333 start_codon:yes stop_codon:yes gene_type:complete
MTSTTKGFCADGAYCLYLIIYEKNDGHLTTTEALLTTYTGITMNLKRRLLQHEHGSTRTTKRFNKSYQLKEVRFIEFWNKTDCKKYEKIIKKFSVYKKLNYSSNWFRWLE